MIFHPLRLSPAFLIEPERMEDERGFFARTWCRDEFAEHGLNPDLAQCSLSFNARRGTLRGMHYQAPPHGEVKVVRCTRGALLDVIIDLRPDSPTRGRWTAVELTEENHLMLYVPEGFAHGFQSLVDSTEVFYQMSSPHDPDAARGVRFDDPAFAIPWPIPDPVVSETDRTWPLWR